MKKERNNETEIISVSQITTFYKITALYHNLLLSICQRSFMRIPSIYSFADTSSGNSWSEQFVNSRKESSKRNQGSENIPHTFGIQKDLLN